VATLLPGDANLNNLVNGGLALTVVG